MKINFITNTMRWLVGRVTPCAPSLTNQATARRGLTRPTIAGFAATLALMLLATSSFADVSLSIGTLPVGKTVRVKYQITVNSTLPAGIHTITNQGSVTSSSPTVSTDDPNVGGTSDPTVTEISIPPVVSTFAKTVAEDTTLTFAAADFTGHYSDANSDALASVKITSLPVNGALKLGVSAVTLNQVIASASLGTLTYLANTNYNGSDSFNWNANDGTFDAASDATVNLTVTEVNDPPTAVDDTLTTVNQGDGVRTIPFSDLLANDSVGPASESSQTLTVIGVGTFVGGTASISGNNVLFTPTPAFSGTASFIYTNQDNGTTAGANDFKSASATASFTINAVAPNHAPTGADNTITINEDTNYTFAVGDYGFADSDVPANHFDHLKITTLPTAGTLTFNGGGISAGDEVSVLSGVVGDNWIPHSAAGSRNWTSLASSADGSKLVAVADGDQIYTSTDSGTNWTARDSSRSWTSVASAADGSKLVAVEYSSQIYTSTDSGTNWTAQFGGQGYSWQSVASSADGSKLVAGQNPGQIYTSTDSGTNWTARIGDRGNFWWSVASSADGSKLVAMDSDGGKIYTSTDSGTNWTARISNNQWQSVASSADGNNLVAVANMPELGGGFIYTSTDSGTNWTSRESVRLWQSVASSVDGSKLVAVVLGGQIYLSTDSGTNWTAHDNRRDWSSVASSADGNKVVAAENGGQSGGQIYTSLGLVAQLVFTPATHAYGSPYASFTFQVGDDGGTANGGIDLDPTPRTMTINVAPVDSAPTAIALSNTNIAENQPSGTTVGSFSDTDTDIGDTAAYTLVSGTGSTDNASFTINGTNLLTAASFDYETKSNYSILLAVTDSHGLSFTNQFTIQVTNVNEAPTSLALNNNSVAENQSSGTTVGGFSDTDPDAGDTAAYALVRGTGSTDNGSFTISGTNLLTAAGFDFETKNSYSILVAVTDGGGLSFTNQFTINVTNVNEAPTDIALSSSTVNENAAIGTTVGGFSDTDPDTSATAGYTLVTGTGSGDNNSFSVSGTNLLTATTLSYATQSSYSIRVRATDGGGLSFEKQFTITVNPVNHAPSFILAGQAWTPRDNNRSWVSVASSADGTKLVAVALNDQLYTSTDSGATWTPRDSVRSLWRSVASSADGTKLAATLFFGNVYTSTNSGVTWTPRDSVRRWTALASSADGTKLVAPLNRGQILISADSGVTWTPRDSTRNWNSAASSADGTNLVATVNPGQIYNSTDSGVTWTPRDSVRNWSSVASSSDGTKFVAAVQGGQIYTSTDSGVTWTPRASGGNWSSVASSSDGTKLVAVAQNGPIYISADSGLNWAAKDTSRNWLAVAASADGTKVVAAESGGQIYTSPATLFLTAADNSGANTQANFATNIIAGPANESGQILNFILNNNNNALFSVQPTMDANGTLAFTPAHGTTGTAIVTVQLHDDGGIANGGADTSPTQIFSITVFIGNKAPTAIALSNTNIAENQTSGAVVGGFSDTDPDAGDTASYTLVSGTGSTDNASFTINGTNLLTAASFDFETKNSYSIRVKVTDSGGLSFTNQFTIQVTNVNEAPTSLALNNNSVAENQSSATVVGGFSAADPDAGDTASYALVSGTGSTDNGSFTISGTNLLTATSFNFEAKNSYSVLVAVTDGGGLSFTNQFTINVLNVNEAPTDIALGNASIAENKSAGCIIGAFSDTDPDANDTAAYTFVSGTGSDDNGSFTIAGGKLKSAVSFDYETKNSYTIRVRVTDGGGLFFEKQFTISISNVNEAPTDIALSHASIAENKPVGCIIGTFSDTDVDAGDTATYTLVTGTGGDDNASFSISGCKLKSAVVFNYEAKNSYTIRVRVTDAGGLYFEKSFTISISNVNEQPAVAVDTAILTGTNHISLANTGTFADPDGNATATVTASVGTVTQDNNAGTWSWSYTPSTVAASPVTVTITATDSGSLTATTTFTYVDFDPIALACSGDRLITSTNGVAVTFTNIATGGCSTPNITAVPASGSHFPLGDTLVNVSATDSCGHTQTCSFYVTVINAAPAPSEFQDAKNLFPPSDAALYGLATAPAQYGANVIIQNFRVRTFSQNLAIPALSATRTDNYTAMADFSLSLDGGHTFTLVTNLATISALTTHTSDTAGKNFLDTEIVSMTLGQNTFLLRESPTKASLGHETLRGTPGTYWLSGYYDIFTEISLDGGTTWIPDHAPLHTDLRIVPRNPKVAPGN